MEGAKPFYSKVCVPAFDAGVGRIAGCTDPQGAFFYLIKLAQPGS